jgi:hypothetical protein
MFIPRYCFNVTECTSALRPTIYYLSQSSQCSPVLRRRTLSLGGNSQFVYFFGSNLNLDPNPSVLVCQWWSSPDCGLTGQHYFNTSGMCDHPSLSSSLVLCISSPPLPSRPLVLFCLSPFSPPLLPLLLIPFFFSSPRLLKAFRMLLPRPPAPLRFRLHRGHEVSTLSHALRRCLILQPWLLPPPPPAPERQRPLAGAVACGAGTRQRQRRSRGAVLFQHARVSWEL